MKRLARILLLLIVVLCLTACGGGSKTVTQPSSATTQIQQTESTPTSTTQEIEKPSVEVIIDEVVLVDVTNVKDAIIEETEEQTETSAEQGRSYFFTSDTSLFDGYTLIKVDGGDLSGHREANVVVGIGFGEREYWAFTNDYGQLVKVVAAKIILQDESTEPVNANGRYYTAGAKVPGSENSNLERGHVIADSLGGVANAYNITPQDKTLNRYGNQAYMEKAIQNAGGCTDFTAIITYPNTETQIPSHYSYTYTLKGNVIVDDFDNVNPDEVNAGIIKEENEPKEVQNGIVKIIALDKRAEYVTIENTGSSSIDMSGWRMVSVRGQQSFTFPSGYILESGQKCKLTSGDIKGTGDFTMANTTIWNNSESDPAELYDNKGVLIDIYED